MLPRERQEGVSSKMKKYCTKCGKPFDVAGRAVICPSCKEAAAAEAKRAAVLKAKRASWTGESVPVRISGRASTVIREYGAAHNMPFAVALDDLLKATSYYASMGKEWQDVTPYKSHRRDKHTATSTAETSEAKQDVPQEAKQDVQDEPVKPVKTAAKQTSKASKASANKAAAKAASKASKSSAK